MRRHALAALAATGLLLLALAGPARAASFDPASMPTLRQGSRGAAVETLQQALSDWWVRRGQAAIAVDGDFGPRTRQAVIGFQWAFSLVPDGVAGPNTWRTLAAATPSPSGPPPGALAGYTQSAEAVKQAGYWVAARLRGTFAVVDVRANGNRPVAVYLPSGFDPSRPARMLTYLHGHYGSIGAGFASSKLFGRIEDLAARYPQTVFAFAQASAPPFSYWFKSPEDYAAFDAQALAIARDLAGGRAPAISSRIVSAHSGAGLALRNAVVAGTLRADRLELLDCAYGDWGQVVAAWASSRRVPIEAWDTAGSTRTNDADIRRRYPSLVTVHASAVGHGDIPTRYLGTALSY